MKRRIASVLFVLALTTAFLTSLFVAGPALVPNSVTVHADEECTGPDFVCFGSGVDEYCCLRLCSGVVIRPCLPAG